MRDRFRSHVRFSSVLKFIARAGLLRVRAAVFPRAPSLLPSNLHSPTRRANGIHPIGKRFYVADTKKIADKAERKKVKRAARKKAAPKAKRTTPRGTMKKKVKKRVRGQSKR